MVDEKSGGADVRHQLVLSDRESVTIKGVGQVISFDEAEIILDTDMGNLTIKGEDLHIKHLDLDKGVIAIEGLVKALEYNDNTRGRGAKGKGKGLLERLLK